MDGADAVLSALVVITVVTSLGWEVWRLRDAEERRRYRAVIRQLRWWMVPVVLLLLTVVLGVYLWLARVAVFRLSWWTALGGAGNPVLAHTQPAVEGQGIAAPRQGVRHGRLA